MDGACAGGVWGCPRRTKPPAAWPAGPGPAGGCLMPAMRRGTSQRPRLREQRTRSTCVTEPGATAKLPNWRCTSPRPRAQGILCLRRRVGSKLETPRPPGPHRRGSAHTLIDKPATLKAQISASPSRLASAPHRICCPQHPAPCPRDRPMDRPMETPQDFKSLQDGIQKSLVSAVKTVNRIAAEDLGFQRAVDPDVAEQLDESTARVLALSTRLLAAAGKACGVKPPALEDVEDIDLKWQSLVDVVDSALEKADTALDEYTGLVKRKEPPAGSDPAPGAKRAKPTTKVVRNANVSKPQLLFEDKPDNFPTGPWKPILTSKPHAAVPLGESLVLAPNENGTPQYKHPYESEIKQMTYPDRVFTRQDPIPPQPAESTTATWVDTYQGVLDMLEALKGAEEIAVDLEHHDFRTYTGLVCLMQISTREQDWIVDTLQPWRRKLEVLNEVFADPSIVKVFHGAYMDMVWLQRDLGLYVNGLFDTFFACDLLAYPGKSLAFLLSKFVDFDADKQYQLADWRIRPIPDEMMYYARSDTHYLLYIFDRLRNELVATSDRRHPETDLIARALQRSRDLALSRHENPDYDEGTGLGPRGWFNFLLKQSHLGLDGEQFAMFRALWKWRDTLARQEDESPNFVLGTNNLVGIARVNPPDLKALHSLLPVTAPLARPRFKEIWELMQEAKARGGPTALGFYTAGAHPQEPGGGGSAPKAAVAATQMPGPDVQVAVRSLPQSQLFGSMPISTLWESRRAPQQDEGHVPFPWQRFVQDAPDEAVVEAAAAAVPIEAATAAADAMDEDVDQEEFTLKKGRKRKSAAVDDEAEQPAAPAEEADVVISIEDEEAPGSRKKSHATRRAEREARKAQRRQERQQREQGGGPAQADEEPFDYSQARSVLHAKQDGASTPSREPKKVFDPYAKTGDDALKGARRAPPVRGERSATFKK
ncbi:exosome nuclease subunit [Purpureocillium takamizusanense]|uniref:Exosome nuclease subunit n=1 Tax=Purpureocillium takamizusanense TaxID=2060973 RepID=A0A9Q8QE10_9HYPO|nr:exosome nuclease subunit [Purpureocillium takamizusanense]UNI17532.1 exosome nuclease subunit [Purpureocillium takamizusanense]